MCWRYQARCGKHAVDTQLRGVARHVPATGHGIEHVTATRAALREGIAGHGQPASARVTAHLLGGVITPRIAYVAALAGALLEQLDAGRANQTAPNAYTGVQ